MSLEIERRFLIKDKSWKRFVTKKTYIEQGYLATDNKDWIIRIRSENNKFKLALKKNIHNFTNYEFEYVIPYKEGMTIIKSIENKIEKERFYLKVNNAEWIVDCFKGRNYPLQIAEIELAEETQDIDLPLFVSKEITGLSFFSNAKLSKSPFTTWSPDKLKQYL